MNFANLSHASFLVFCLFVVSFYHVSQLVNVTAWEHVFPHSLFGLQLLPRLKLSLMLVVDYTFAYSLLWVLFIRPAKILSELVQLLIFGGRLITIFRQFFYVVIWVLVHRQLLIILLDLFHVFPLNLVDFSNAHFVDGLLDSVIDVAHAARARHISKRNQDVFSDGIEVFLVTQTALLAD